MPLWPLLLLGASLSTVRASTTQLVLVQLIRGDVGPTGAAVVETRAVKNR